MEISIIHQKIYEIRGQKVNLTPFAFSEHGVTMLASVLKSKKAIQINIAIVEAFIILREFALNYKDVSEKLKTLEEKYNHQFKDVYEAINYLLQKDKQEVEQKQRTKIGFKKPQGLIELTLNKFTTIFLPAGESFQLVPLLSAIIIFSSLSLPMFSYVN